MKSNQKFPCIAMLLVSLALLSKCADPESNVQAEPATRAQIDRISSGLEDGFRIRNAYTTRSEAHQNASFVAAELVGPGVSGEVAVWIHNRLPQDPGLLMSVDGLAKEFSVFPDATQSRASASMSDKPARALKRYVEKRVDE